MARQRQVRAGRFPGRFLNFYIEFIQFSEYFQAKFVSLLMFIFVLKQCSFPSLSSSFSLSFPFSFLFSLFLHFFPFSSSFSLFLPFFLLSPFFLFLLFPFLPPLSLPDFSPSRFLVSGGQSASCPPGYANVRNAGSHANDLRRHTSTDAKRWQSECTIPITRMTNISQHGNHFISVQKLVV